MMMSEVMGQPENSRHVTTADLSGGFANFTVELGRLFHDEDTGVRAAALQH